MRKTIVVLYVILFSLERFACPKPTSDFNRRWHVCCKPKDSKLGFQTLIDELLTDIENLKKPPHNKRRNSRLKRFTSR